MSLTRTEYAHAKYPWEYTTEELLSLFEITRDSQLLSAGKWQDSGIIESLKMLEQQLRFLSIIAYKRVEKFSGYEGEIACLYSSNIVPTLAVQNITYDGGAVSHIRDWIDNLRSDYGLSAWSWSNTGRTLFNIAIVKELWYATGLVHESTWGDQGTNNRSVTYYPGPGFSFWNGVGPFALASFGQQAASRALRSFGEETRISGVKTYLLFRHGESTPTYYNLGMYNLSWYINVNISSAQNAYESGDYIPSSFTPLNNTNTTGANGSYQFFDNTSYHPSSGSGYIVYKYQFGDLLDGDTEGSWLVDLETGLTSIDNGGTYLWQTLTSNPYS